MTPSRALRTIGERVEMTRGVPSLFGIRSRTAIAHEACGFGGPPTTSIRHMRQLPAIESRSWKQKRGIRAPAASPACSRVYSGGTSISVPSTMSLVMMPPSLRRHAHGLRMRVRRILVDAPLDLGAEVPQQALHRPGRAVAERADGVTLDLLGHFEQHVDLALLGAAFGHAGEHAPHPAHALAARRALAAALVLVEIRNARHRADDVGRLIHDDHGRGPKRGLQCGAA